MSMKPMNAGRVFTVLVALAASAPAASVERSQASNGATVTRIREAGPSGFVNLYDEATQTNGFLNVSRDKAAGTTALDFSYVTPSTSNSDLVTLIQGSGEIPNSAFNAPPNLTTARLAVTTPFPVILCEVDITVGNFICWEAPPVTFDLTWTRAGLWETSETFSRRTTLGPVTVKEQGQYMQRDAAVAGNWGDYVTTGMLGELRDAKKGTVVREITIQPNP